LISSSFLLPQALVNIGEILKAAGCNYSNGEIHGHQVVQLTSCFSHTFYVFDPISKTVFFISVVKTTMLLTDINNLSSVNEVYKTCKPTTLLFCSVLMKGKVW